MTQRTYGNSTYHNFEGKIYWARLFEPDEFRGSVRWTTEFMPKNENELNKIKTILNPAKKIRDATETIPGKHLTLARPAFKLIKGSLVHFTPPVIYDKDGWTTLVDYVDEEGNRVRSYGGEKRDIATLRKGDLFNIGNGTDVKVNVVTYPTQMGIGMRLEAVTILDLVEYIPSIKEEETEEVVEEPVKETKKTTKKTTVEEELNDEIPW